MANRNRTAGLNLERTYINDLKGLGFDVGSTRQYSPILDGRKVDIMDVTELNEGPQPEFPHQIQVKNMVPNLNYHAMFTDETRSTRKPWVIMHQKTEKRGERFMKVGEYVIMDKPTYYDLIQKAYGPQDDSSEDVNPE